MEMHAVFCIARCSKQTCSNSLTMCFDGKCNRKGSRPASAKTSFGLQSPGITMFLTMSGATASGTNQAMSNDTDVLQATQKHAIILLEITHFVD